EVLGGVGLTQRASDRAAVTDDRISDHLFGVAEHRRLAREQLGIEQLRVARQRPDSDLASVIADVGELVLEIVDVDQVCGSREPQLHHREQAVASGDDPSPGPDALERRDHALDARRALVVTWCRGLHQWFSFVSGGSTTAVAPPAGVPVAPAVWSGRTPGVS